MANVYHGRGYVYSIQYHIVWCVKYRHKILNNKIENIISKCEKEFDDDAEGIITAERYEFIGSIVSKIIKKKEI